jgi:hypothetical protein
MLPRKQGIIAAIRKSNSGRPVKPVSPLDIEGAEATIEKSKGLGRERLNALVAVRRRKKTTFQSL